MSFSQDEISPAPTNVKLSGVGVSVGSGDAVIVRVGKICVGVVAGEGTSVVGGMQDTNIRMIKMEKVVKMTR